VLQAGDEPGDGRTFELGDVLLDLTTGPVAEPGHLTSAVVRLAAACTRKPTPFCGEP
jgi:hypothetical protein